MNRASSSFLLFILAVLFVSFQSYAQVRGTTLQETLHRDLRPFERLRLAELFRLTYQEEADLEIISLSISAQNVERGRPARLELTDKGRILSTEMVRPNQRDIQFQVPVGSTFESLELSSSSLVYLTRISAEVRYRRIPGPGTGPGHFPRPNPGYETPATPNSFLILRLYHNVRGYSVISVDQLARQQYGVNLEGAEVEMVVVQGEPVMYGRTPTVQVEVNHRPVGDIRYLTYEQNQVPLPLYRGEVVRSLSLIVNGDALITEIRVRVGQVRPRFPEIPSSQRIMVHREVGPGYPLYLGDIIRHESRLVRAITIEARSTRQLNGELSILAGQREIQGVLRTGPNSMRATIQLRRPVSVQELRFESLGFSVVETVELQF